VGVAAPSPTVSPVSTPASASAVPTAAPTVSRAAGEALPSPPGTKPRFTSAGEAQRAAVSKYPDLGVAGSPFHTRFMAEYYRLRRDNPNVLNTPDWPMVLADKTAREVAH
jgi:hypothetical protein